MRMMVISAALMSLACVAAAEGPDNYQSYDGVKVDTDQVVLAHFDKAMGRCGPESDGPRGSPDPLSMPHIVALRSCLSRYGFIDRGAYAYPGSAVFDHFLDR